MVQKNDEINKKFCHSFTGILGDTRGGNCESVYSDFFTGKYEYRTFRNDIKFSAERFIGWHLSAYYAPTERDDFYAKYTFELMKLFDQYSENGILIYPNVTRCFSGEVK
jgi:hypothetical protein